jgi:hypothetical protein
LSPITLVGYGAVAALVVGWLVVSFSPPSPRRTLLEWLSASALYLALLMLFTNLSLRAREDGSTFVLVAFLFLCALFGGGLLVSLYNALTSLRAPGKAESSATN